MHIRRLVTPLLFLCAYSGCRTTATGTKAANGGQSSDRGGVTYRSGRVGTYETFLYGAFESQLQGPNGAGFITPFYLYKLPAPVNDKGWQEIDFELFGKDGRFQTQVLTPGNPRKEHQVFHTLEEPNFAGMHVYRMEWTPTSLRFIVDGKVLREETDQVEYAKIFKDAEPMILYMQLWAGTSGWSGVFDPSASPAWSLFKYVQVETYTPGAGPNGSDFTLYWRDDFSSFNSKRWGRSSAKPDDGAVNGYDPNQVSTRNGNLILYFSN